MKNSWPIGSVSMVQGVIINVKGKIIRDGCRGSFFSIHRAINVLYKVQLTEG